MRGCEVLLNYDCMIGSDQDVPVRTTCYRCGSSACKDCSWVSADPLIPGLRTRRCREDEREDDGAGRFYQQRR